MSQRGGEGTRGNELVTTATATTTRTARLLFVPDHEADDADVEQDHRQDDDLDAEQDHRQDDDLDVDDD